MGVTTQDIFRDDRGEPATPDSYGEKPRGYRLPAATQLGPVQLRVANLDRSIAFYTQVLGLRETHREGDRARLAPAEGSRTLVELHEVAGVGRPPKRGRTGLYHFAILLPTRAALGQFVRHLAASNVYAGASDHLVSEAFYLSDPDGLGIEVYADRPRDTWRRVGRELMMATDPIDMRGLVAAAGDTEWTGMPAGTVMGHVHLHVGALDKAAAFYGDAVGFDRIAWSYPGALFMSAGGYHHHLGTNIWAGAGATPPTADEAGLIEWTLVVPTAADVAAVGANVAAAGFAVSRDGGDVLTTDPWGTGLRVRGAA